MKYQIKKVGGTNESVFSFSFKFRKVSLLAIISLFSFSLISETLCVFLRYQMEGEYDPRFNLSGQGLMPMTEVNNPSSLWKQV